LTVLITLTTADANTGPFDLYANTGPGGSMVLFEDNVNKAALLPPGYLTIVPDGATIVRVQSIGDCTTYTDIVLTTIPPVACGATSSSGGAGIAERTFDLTPEGGVLIIGANAQGVPDKFEIIHNGIKKSTTGMTVANSGPFDNVYGTPPSNVVPISPAEENVDQFIGTSSNIAGGVIPTRNAAFAADNPTLSYIVAAPQQQLIWWNYTPLDYITAQQAILRITGPTGTAWNILRKCESTTTTSSSSTTSTSSTSSTTTTTTTLPMFFYDFSESNISVLEACADIAFTLQLSSINNPVNTGNVMLTVPGGVPFAGGGNWYRISSGAFVIQINGSGVIIAKTNC